MGPWRATIFFLSILCLLALPWISASSRVLPAHVVFEAVPTEVGYFSFLRDQIFFQQGAVDVAVVGPSLVWGGVDLSILGKEYYKKRKNNLVLLNMGHNWEGAETDYFLVKSLLGHRPVRLLIIGAPVGSQGSHAPHIRGSYWWNSFEHPEVLEGLPSADVLCLYAQSVLGGPRHLLSLFHKNEYQTPEAAVANHGSYLARMGFDHSEFKAATFTPPSVLPERLIFSNSSGNRPSFSEGPLSRFQYHFYNKIISLARSRGTRVVFLSLPTYSRRSSEVVLSASLEGLGDVPLVGIPPRELFRGLSEEEIKLLYVDMHFNANGAKYFTKAVSPALLKLYEN